MPRSATPRGTSGGSSSRSSTTSRSCSARETGQLADFEIARVGVVESPLREPASAPKQGDEGAPEASIVLDDGVVEGLEGIRPGDELIVLTWLHLADRDVLRVHPRGDRSRPAQGVFGTRSPHRPNPIGLHRVEVVSLEGARLTVRNLEAVDGTPVVDLKPVLSADPGER